MNTPESLKHTKWECKYHIVWIPKYRKKSLYKDLRQYLGKYSTNPSVKINEPALV